MSCFGNVEGTRNPPSDFVRGDLIMYQNGYYQIDNIIANQYIVGKNPDYPNEPNPLNSGLSSFGSNFSVKCKAHYEPADKFGITQERF